jgi:hypothetical protein
MRADRRCGQSSRGMFLSVVDFDVRFMRPTRQAAAST